MASATDKTVTVGPFDPNAINKQSDIIGPATVNAAGVMTAAQVQKLDGLLPATTGVAIANYSDTGVGAPVRPDPALIGATAEITVMIWNVDDKAPNFSGSTDGGLTFNWYNAEGELT